MNVKRKAVVVTTKHRGVFFGYIEEGIDITQRTLHIESCRMCIKWPVDNRGVIGLAALGPVDGAKVTPAAPAITLQDITSVMECSERAALAWESEPWS